jgi:DNA-binding NarL/FixJ family response regulator
LGLTGSDGFFVGHSAREFKDRAGKAKKHKKLIAGLVLLGKKIREIAAELKLSVSLIKRRRSEIKKTEGFTYWETVQI